MICHTQPWTSASAHSLEAIGHLLKQLVCHLHFFTFPLATLSAHDACHVCRFYSTSTELSFCTHWLLLLQGVMSAGGGRGWWGSDLQCDSELEHIEVAVSHQQLRQMETVGTHPEKKSGSTARLLQIPPKRYSLVLGLVGQPRYQILSYFSLLWQFFY